MRKENGNKQSPQFLTLIQELEQCLRFFVDHKQKNQLKQLAIAEFVVNNKA